MTRLTISDAVSAAEQISATPDRSTVGTAIGSERERPILSDDTSSRGPQNVMLTLCAIAVAATFIIVAASYALRQPSVRQDLGLSLAPARELARAPALSPFDLGGAEARADRLPEVPPATDGTIAPSKPASAATAAVATIAPGRDKSTARGSKTSTTGIADDLPPINAAELPPLPSATASPGAQPQQEAAENDDPATTIGPPVSLLPQGR